MVTNNWSEGPLFRPERTHEKLFWKGGIASSGFGVHTVTLKLEF